MLNNLTFLNTFVFLISILYSLRTLGKTKSLLLLPVSTIAILVTNSFFIPFIGNSNINYKFPADENIQFKAFFVILIFTLLSLFFQSKLIKYSRKKFTNIQKSTLIESTSFTRRYFFYILVLISLLAFVRYVFVSGGINYLGAMFAYTSSHSDYYYQRTRGLSIIIASLPGLGFARITSSYVNYVLLCILIVFDNRIYSSRSYLGKLIDLSLIIYLISSNFVINTIIGQRSGISTSIILTLFLFYTSAGNATIHFRKLLLKFSSFQKIIRLLINKYFFGSVFVILLIFLIYSFFIYFFSADVENPFYSFLDRAFIVPCGTNNYYYFAFPEKIPYLGLVNSFEAPEGLYSEVSFLNTGASFGANTSFLAIAYSGFGYLGVLIVSFIFCFISFFHDCFLIRQSFKFQFYSVFCNLIGILALTSASLVTATVWTGVFISTFLLNVSLRAYIPQVDRE